MAFAVNSSNFVVHSPNFCYLQVMSVVSFSVLFLCGLVYNTPPEPAVNMEENEETGSDTASLLEDEPEEETDIEEEVFYHETLWKNKPLLIFLLSTYMLNFGYYVPYVHLVSLTTLSVSILCSICSFGEFDHFMCQHFMFHMFIW